MFLTPEEIAKLTGYKIKSLQIIQLRKMGIAAFVNGSGHPVVTRSAVEGNKVKAQNDVSNDSTWIPKPLRA